MGQTSIRVTNVSSTPTCAGSTVTITFSTTNGNGGTVTRFSNSTVYTVFLSNRTGTTFTQIGSTFSTSGVVYTGGNGGVTSGITATVTIPASAVSGTRYRISLSSSRPGFDGSTGRGASPFFTIIAAPTAIAGTAVSTCSASGAVNITAGSSASNNSGVTWTSSGTGTFANTNSLTTATYAPSAGDIAAGNVTLTLTATGNSPCGIATSAKTLTITAAPTVLAGTAVSTCSNSGAVNITAGASATNSNGVGWTSSGTGTFANANSLTAATYTPSAGDITSGSVTLTLTATGNSPCGNAISTKTLTISQAPTTANAGAGQTLCGATTTALAANTPTFGTGSWAFAATNTGTGGSFGDPASPTSTFSGTPGSTYLLRWRITTSTCGTSGNNVRIVFGENPNLSLSKKDVSNCDPGSDDGVLKGVAISGTSPYQYSFNGGAFQNGSHTTPDSIIFNNLKPADSYTLQVRDANGCTSAIQNTNIILEPGPSISVSTLYNVSACGTTNGYFTLRVANSATAAKPYFFKVTPQGADTTGVPFQQKNFSIMFSSLPEGQYQVTMKDSKGCISNTVSGITISKDNPLTLETRGITNPSCNNNDGDIILLAHEGSHSTYRYSLSKDGVALITNQSGRFLGNLGAGTYTVTARDSRGCQTPPMNITLDTKVPFITASATPASSCAATDGAITVRPTGGFTRYTPYTYSLSTDNGATFTVNQSSQTFSNLPAGSSYAVRATDANGCVTNIVTDISVGKPTNCSSVTSGSFSSARIPSKNSLDLQVLPNPTRMAFTLNLQSNGKESVQIIVTDMFGKKLYQTTGSGNQQYTFGKEFRSGMYIVQVIQGKEIQTLKLIKGN